MGGTAIVPPFILPGYANLLDLFYGVKYNRVVGNLPRIFAEVAELADAQDLKSCGI